MPSDRQGWETQCCFCNGREKLIRNSGWKHKKTATLMPGAQRRKKQKGCLGRCPGDNNKQGGILATMGNSKNNREREK